MQQAVAAWGYHILDLALETSTLWNTSCVVRLSLVYRGRAVPLVWKVLEHPSSRVAYDIYQDVLEKVAELLPCQDLARLGWHWRMRIQGRFWIYRDGMRRGKVNRMHLPAGKTLFWHHVYMTKQRYGPVPMAVARCHAGKE